MNPPPILSPDQRSKDAAIDCLHIPLGTILGVFTIIILNRDSVRKLYDLQPKA